MFERINNIIEQAESLLERVNPSWALSRARARQMLGAYEAAKPRRNRVMRGEARGPDLVANESVESLRSQARFLDENYDIVTGALDTLVARTVGPRGIMVEPMVMNKNGDLNDDINRQINDLFCDWWENPEVKGEYSGSLVEQLAVRTWLRDGEMFTQMIEGDKPGLSRTAGIPFHIEIMEPDLVPVNYENSSIRLFQGIEKNAWGRPIKYWVYRGHPNDYSYRLPAIEDLKPIKGDNLIHLKMVKRIGQTRGISLLHAVITRLEDLKDYEESERIAARISAAAAFYIKKGNPDSFIPEDTDTADEERSFKIKPGMVFDRLREGEEVGSIQSNRPSTLLEPFRNAMVKAVASGTRTGYSSISKDYKGSYSSQRQELVEQWEHYATLQQQFAKIFKAPIYRRFLRMAILSGKIKVPAEVDEKTLYRAHYQGPAMPWIDPDKESKANERNNKAGYNTRSAIIRSRNENPLEVEQQLARERKREKELGLVLTSNAENEIQQPQPVEQQEQKAEEVQSDD